MLLSQVMMTNKSKHTNVQMYLLPISCRCINLLFSLDIRHKGGGGSCNKWNKLNRQTWNIFYFSYMKWTISVFSLLPC